LNNFTQKFELFQYGEECVTITASEDRRFDKRLACEIPIVVSPFNLKDSTDAILMDHCMIGIGFLSIDAFFIGTVLVVKVAYGAFKDFHNGDLQQLPSIGIGEVKWCRKHPDDKSNAYKMGIKYYHQFY